MVVSFDIWFDLFSELVRSSGYDGPIDKSSFEDWFEDGKSPEMACVDFLEEIS